MFGEIRAEENVGEGGARRGSKWKRKREWVQKKRKERRG